MRLLDELMQGAVVHRHSEDLFIAKLGKDYAYASHEETARAMLRLSVKRRLEEVLGVPIVDGEGNDER